MPEVLTTSQLSEKLNGVHENTLARWRKDGMPHHAAGGKFVYSWPEVEEWLNENDKGGYVLLADTHNGGRDE